MGVKGLWKILDSAERPISSPESLAGQKVAIDASIWLYQFLRVFPNASTGTTGYSPLVLAGLFQRICKLLYFDIRPVMVFDGIPPSIKQQTIKSRAERRGVADERYRRLARKMIAAQLCRNRALGDDDGKKISTKGDTFEAIGPTIPAHTVDYDNPIDNLDEYNNEIRETDFLDDDSHDVDMIDEEYLASVDTTSKEFSRWPINVQQEILLAKREYVFRQHAGSVRKDRHQMKSLEFSNRQIDALVKRRRLAAQLERVNEEGSGLIDYEGSHASLNAFGERAKIQARRIASEERKSYLLIKGKDGGWVMNDSQDDQSTIVTTEKQPDLPVREDDFEAIFGREANIQPASELVLEKFTKPQELESDFAKKEELSFDVAEYFSKTNIEKSPQKTLSPKPQIINTKSEEIKRKDVVLSIEKTINDEKVGQGHQDLELTQVLIEEPVLVEESSSSTEDEDLTTIVGEYTNQALLPVESNHELIEKLQQNVEDIKEGQSLNTLAAYSASINEELLEDFRNLLTIVGIPWVVAPGEAEAQCAWMQQAGLVDGVLSDDSDTLLFGATRVYRHFFDNERRIGMYLMRDLERELKLNEDRLIILALLLGSDYNYGIRGVGPVKAREILRILDGLDLRKSLEILQTGLIHGSWPNELQSTEADVKFLKKLSTQCAMPENFKFNEEAISAFQRPIIDKTQLTFKWRFLNDLNSLYNFLQKKLQWDLEQCKRIVEPIVRKRLHKSTGPRQQTSLDTFLYKH